MEHEWLTPSPAPAAASWKAYLPKLYAGRRPDDFDAHRDAIVASLKGPGRAKAFALTPGSAMPRPTAVVLDVIAGYGLAGSDAVDAARAIRSALHGFIVLEQDRGFGLPVDIDRSFDRLVDALCRGLATWAEALEAS